MPCPAFGTCSAAVALQFSIIRRNRRKLLQLQVNVSCWHDHARLQELLLLKEVQICLKQLKITSLISLELLRLVVFL